MDNFWSLLGTLFWAILIGITLVAYLIPLFWVISDLVRDRTLNGWWKALWVVLLLLLPVVTVLAYLIARGSGMAERQDAWRAARESVPPTHDGHALGASEEIEKAKQLLDAGAISPEEFAALKRKAIT